MPQPTPSATSSPASEPSGGPVSLIDVYLSRRMAVLLGLGFASGLPLLLTASTLQAWLTNVGIRVETVVAFTLVTLPYAFKFVWAPVLDRVTWPLLGRRRGWLLLTQAGVSASLAAMAWAAPSEARAPLWPMTLASLAVAFCSASQDIVADAYRTDVLADAQRGAGAAVFVTGYRLGMIVGGAVALVLSRDVGWPGVYLLMAAAMGVGVAATLLAREPIGVAPPSSLAEAVVEPFREFFARRGAATALFVLAFIVVFKLPDVVAKVVTMPFLLDELAFSNAQVGTIQQGLGMAMTIIGALMGGAVVAQLGIIGSLWVFGVLQAVSNLGFLVLAALGRSVGVLTGVIAVENFCGGLVAAGFIAFLMSCCDRRFSATQYALLSSLMAISGTLLGAPMGHVVETTGYGGFFLLSVLAAAPGLALLPALGQVHRPRGD